MRKLTAVLSAFALAVTLGACGEKDGGANNNSGGSEEAATNLVALAQQVKDSTAETSTAHMVFTADAAGQKIDGEGDLKVGPDDAAMTMTMATPEGDMGFVFLDGVMYLQIPGQEIEPGKTWIKIEPGGDDPMAQALGGLSEEMRKNADPRQALEQFKNSGTITSQEENVELNGEQTTHYEITVDVDKAAQEQNDPAIKKALESVGLKEFPVELWVNDEGLPVRITIDMPMSDPSTGKAIEASVQVDYSKWGEPVEIAAPPADQVTEFPGS
jgi:LppX_LprAFG lipoprotein